MQINQENILAIKNPQLASEWHPTKNENLTQMMLALVVRKRFGG